MDFTALLLEKIERVVTILKIIFHPVRLTILGQLSNSNRLIVTGIHNLLGIEQSITSHHFVQ